MSYMFEKCYALENISVSHFDTSKVGNMYSMFNGCSKLKSLNLSGFDISNVDEMRLLFEGCSNLILIEYGDKFILKEGANTAEMFVNCPANKPTHESWNGVTF